MMFSAEYKIIQKNEDGKYVLDEETVILLANYIAKLEELNKNYVMQISNLEEQVKNLKQLLEIEKKQKELVEKELAEMTKKLNTSRTIAVVVAVVIGTTILLFLK